MPYTQPWICQSKIHTKSLPKKISRDKPLLTSTKHLQSSVKQEGLGVQSDSLANFNIRRPVLDRRHRSASGISQKSATSSSSRSHPVSQYVHPMRQVPDAHTAMGQYDQMSPVESDDSESSLEGGSENQSSPGAFQPSAHAQAPRLSLQIHDGSFTPLPGISQTNVAGRSSFGYARDNASALDTPSPISRSSLDFVFRSKTRASVDPVSRAATVQAARQAFEEKEEAKSRKLEQQQMKAEEKQTRRKEKQHWRTSIRDDDDDAIRSSTPEEISEKPNTSHKTPASQPQPTSTSWKTRSKSTWMLFITWLRTRVFKLRRRIRN